MSNYPLIGYRFFAICFFSTMGLMGVVHRQVGHGYIFGDEATAFGVTCLLISAVLIILDIRTARAARNRRK